MSFQRGEYIIRQGEEGNHFYIIKMGTVEIRKEITRSPKLSEYNNVNDIDISDDKSNIREGNHNIFNFEDVDKPRYLNRECTESTLVAELFKGDYFGEIALIKSERRTANVIAATDVQVLRLTRSDFKEKLTALSVRMTMRVCVFYFFSLFLFVWSIRINMMLFF